MSEETITTPATSGNSFTPKLTYIHNSKIPAKFEGNCLKEDKMSFTQGNVVNFFTFYKIDIWSHDLSTNFTLKGCLFGAVKLSKNANPDKYSYYVYSNGFNSMQLFLISNFDFDKTIFIVFI